MDQWTMVIGKVFQDIVRLLGVTPSVKRFISIILRLSFSDLLLQLLFISHESV